MILFIACSIYLPGIFIKPKFNFLYAKGNYYYCSSQYSVQNGKLVKNEFEQPSNEIKFFIYDVVKDESREISFEEAQKLNLDSNIESPDGFKVVSGTSYNSQYLKGRNVTKKLNIQFSKEDNYHNYDDFCFLGWIK